MKKVLFTMLALVMVLLFVSCEHELTSHKASLIVNLVPKQSLPQLARYSVEGTGPEGASFSPVYGGTGQISVSELTPGSWTLTARGYNSQGQELARGISSSTLVSGENSVVVTLDAETGTEGLDLFQDEEESASTEPSMTLAIDNKMANPMQVYLDYTPKAPVAGQKITLTAKLQQLPSYVKNTDLKYQWYKDGVLMQVGNTSFTHTLEKGLHRYDVIVTNGLKGATSSATVTFNL